MTTSPERIATRVAPFTLLACLLLAGGLREADANAAEVPRAPLGQRLTAVHAGDPGLPGNVPDGYVITPNGYFHPSCVMEVAADEVVDMTDGTITRAGRAARATPACAWPRFTAGGARIDTTRSVVLHPDPAWIDGRGYGSAPTIPITDDTLFVGTFDRFTGWIESIYAITDVNKSLASMRADMFVPQPPASPLGSTNFFFPGGQNLYQGLDFSTIIQPVLGWNGYSNLHEWTIASWNCCLDGTVYASDFLIVEPGDDIRGTMQGSGCNATTGICSNWSIETRNLTQGNAVTLNSSSHGQAFNWIFAGALEVYNVASCDELSSTGYMDFTNITITDVSGQSPDLTWYTGTPDVSVDCGYEAWLTGDDSIRLVF